MTTRKYSDKMKNELLRLHMEEGSANASLTKEYQLGEGTLSYWVKELRKECQINTDTKEMTLSYEGTKKLLKENEKLEKANNFFKKWRLLCKRNRLEIHPSVYYNFLKNRKKDYEENKATTMLKIVELYHQNNGIPGCQMMRDLLALKDINYCRLTILKYMRELHLYSVVRRRKPNFLKGIIHLIFPDLLQQKFNVSTKNTNWCTDFTYLFLKDGTVRYNCTIIDQYIEVYWHQ